MIWTHPQQLTGHARIQTPKKSSRNSAEAKLPTCSTRSASYSSPATNCQTRTKIIYRRSLAKILKSSIWLSNHQTFDYPPQQLVNIKSLSFRTIRKTSNLKIRFAVKPKMTRLTAPAGKKSGGSLTNALTHWSVRKLKMFLSLRRRSQRNMKRFWKTVLNPKLKTIKPKLN